MRIRKFEAPTLREAMQQAKVELGENAVILNTREVKPLRGASGVEAARVELVAATDESAALAAAKAVPMVASVESAGNPDGLAGEVAALRAALESLVGEGVLVAHTRPGPGPERRLREAGVEAAMASQIAASLRQQVAEEEIARQWTCLYTCAEPALPEDRSVVIALTGPTGGGKTSTVAKLATEYRYRRGKSVAVISCDGQRIGAVEQMRLVAEALRLQFRQCLDRAELSAAIRELSSHQVILVDAPGCSPRDAKAIAALCDLLSDERIEKHLVLPANMAPQVRAATVKAFEPLDPRRLVATKMDEAAGAEWLLAVAQSIPIALSFVTDGQDIAADIHPARADELARQLIRDLKAAS